LQRAALSLGAEQPGAMKAICGWTPMQAKKLSGMACRRASAVVIDVRVQ
jgi:hypothetical protein